MSQQILIIDDDPIVARTLAEQLEVLGFKSTIASDAQTGEGSLRSGTFDLILLDLSLPDRSGLDPLRRWQEESLQVPTVMISGTATIPDAVEALKRGAVDFLVKPVDMRLLEVSATDTSCMKGHFPRRMACSVLLCSPVPLAFCEDGPME